MFKTRFISMLVLLAAVVTGAWAQEQSETIVTTDNNIVEGTHFTISNHDFYADEDGMNADGGITVTSKNGETITKVVISCTYRPDKVNDGNTSVSSGTKEITNGGGTITVTGVNASTFTFTCSDIDPQFVQFVVYYTEAPDPANYTVTLKEGTEDATNWTIDPTSGAQGTTVTVSYSGENKVKSVMVKAIPTVTLSKTALDFDANYYKGSTQTFTVTRDGDGAITATSSNTDVATVSVDGNTVTVTRKTYGTGSATITVGVAATESYAAAAADQNVSVTLSSLSYHLASCEAKHKGWFFAADGYLYPSIAAATNAGTEARAVVAYVGAIEKYCSRALCIALEDVSADGLSWSNAQTAVNTWAASHPAPQGDVTYNTNSIGSYPYDYVSSNQSASSKTHGGEFYRGWRIPSVTDWRYIFQGLAGASATSPAGIAREKANNSTSGADATEAATLRNAINTACGNTNLQAGAYWSSSVDYNNNNWAWGYTFSSGNWFNYNKDNLPHVRAIFAY